MLVCVRGIVQISENDLHRIKEGDIMATLFINGSPNKNGNTVK